MRTLIVGLLFIAHTAFANEGTDFLSWKEQIREQAIAQGITEKTVNQAMASIELLPRVIDLGTRQPEFTQTFLLALWGLESA